jgi:microcystin-dependent protein
LATAATGITVQSTGGGAAHNVMQPSIVLNYLIKS